LADEDYDKIVKARLNLESSTSRPESSEGRKSFNFLREVFGLHTSDLYCSTALVEFKSIAAKQSGKCPMHIDCISMMIATNIVLLQPYNVTLLANLTPL
jgi:hypothetical protein